ncbi:Antitoxin of toxin-antitoxin system [Escherichia coli]|uniref:type IV toxin-antitoxin system YeeU family antitoxin n=3 Tax=Escherichia coli TaxID=562 RepID=UPI000907530C|nr:type IV toxin-antitoxin system YeeU family antitoxin [Escherichia coli]EFC4078730.1 type IV toxin-antitoxin system YeeU family antitoxin [Escherichia coli]EFG4415968.1 type IV toxin-antitoxin system YeeU family antitoxin [Escherichia coli]MDD8543551.1 type IV toxin-antitoxin system YeeU family antitoxin [Escherichia coli]HAW1369409.1 type IV toxin-antitoxin system YeeU family antitoxin [Escherichia coli]HAW5314885.1 type IV toxin-antitoxin system YeeU family antitoxin [Escherichia coli]
MSDTLPGTTLPDDNHDRPWWGLPCTVTPCFGARLVQEGNRLHYLADRAGIRGLFSDADAYHLDQAFPLLMKQLELMLTSGELNPRHQHTVTLYAKGLTCKADTRSQLINSIDILRARRATGLMTRDNYRTVNNITLGKYPEAK